MQRQLTQANTTIKELRTERDALRVERDTLAGILKKNDSKGIQRLITENMRLGTELKQALDRLQYLEKSNDATKDELVQAKSDLAIAKNRIMRFFPGTGDTKIFANGLDQMVFERRIQSSNGESPPPPSILTFNVEIAFFPTRKATVAPSKRLS